MTSNTIDENGSTPWLITQGDGVHLALAGTFGGGTVLVEQRINGAAFPLLNEGANITFTAAADVRLSTGDGDAIRLTTSGATAPSIAYSASRARIDYSTE